MFYWLHLLPGQEAEAAATADPATGASGSRGFTENPAADHRVEPEKEAGGPSGASPDECIHANLSARLVARLHGVTTSRPGDASRAKSVVL